MTIVIVEDHCLIRDLLRFLCKQEANYQLVGEASDGPQAVATILRYRPQLVLLDLHLPGFGGLTVVDSIRKAGYRPQILVMSSYCNSFTVYLIERLEVDGFVDKLTSMTDDLKRAISAMASGRRYFSKSYDTINSSRRQDPLSFDKILTDRELWILTLIGDLKTDSEISIRLNISEVTVEKHRGNLIRKLNLENRAALVRYANVHGITQATGLDLSNYAASRF